MENEQETDYLFDGWFEQSLSGAEVKQLESLLLNDEQARNSFLELRHIDSAVSDWARGDRIQLGPLGGTENGGTGVGDGEAQQRQATIPFVKRLGRTRWPYAAIIFSVLASGTFAFWVTRKDPVPVVENVPDREGIVVQQESQKNEQESRRRINSVFGHGASLPISLVVYDRASVKVRRPALVSEPNASQFVAKIASASADAKFGRDEPGDFLARIRQGDSVDLAQGQITVQFGSDATVDILGPAKFVVLNKNRVKLLAGRLTATAKNGEFNIETPAADVIGAEIGVEVVEEATSAFVFAGTAEFSTRTADGSIKLLALKKGRGKSVDQEGKISDLHGIDGQRFAITRVPPLAQDRISVVDLIAGGDGTNGYLGGAINPNTGLVDNTLPPSDPGDLQIVSEDWFYPNSESKFIDGTFVVNAEGKEVVLNSLGHYFVQLRANDGSTWGPIWARRNRLLPSESAVIKDPWGREVFGFSNEKLKAEAEYGMIGLHPNVGITFDLDAIRQHHGLEYTKFSATLMHLDTTKINMPHPDVWVLENGKPKKELDEWVKSNLHFATFRAATNSAQFAKAFYRKLADSDGIKVELTFGEADRFLTLVTGDSGDTNHLDNVVLIDPVISQ